jgi:uncharacterized membrane protein HdeD (DUF308 family)
MSEPIPDGVESFKAGVAQAIHAHWKLFLAQGIIMIVFGFIAISVPLVSTLAAEILVGWLLIAGGLVRIVSLPRSKATPGFWWSLLAGVAVSVLGVLLIAQPLQGVLTLTMMLIALFILEGVVALFMAFELRKHMQNWGWTLFKGVIDLWLAFLIWSGWPGSATWAIGLLVGVNMLFFGISLAMTAFAARSLKSP